LSVALVAGGGMAARSMSAPAAGAAGGAEGRRLATPVLSPRRAPTLLTSHVAQIRLTSRLDAILDDAGLGAARETTCLTVEDGEAAIYRRRPDERLVPASTAKVLTGMAALRRLGEDFRFVTEVRAAAAPAGGVVDGPLWLVGAGDPLLATAAYAASFRNQPQVYTPLETLADEVVAAGVREVRGGVVGDESRFDDVRYVPTWKPGYRTDNEVGPVSALVVNDNFAQYRPQKAIATDAPARHGAAVLTALLRERGVVVGEPGQGTAPAGAGKVAAVSSVPLPEVVGQMLRESDNMTAEVLTKELGRRFGAAGSWPEGIRVVRATVAEAGLPVEGYAALDGSGLDVGTRLSCTVLMDALDLAGAEGPVAAGFPVAGQSGTLADRFKGNPAEGRLRAKTGSLNNVAGLVGFVEAERGRLLEFALLANGLPDRLASGRALQERVGAALAGYPDAPSPESIGPLPTRAGG
ncbi:MAG TPA: D-alanyl-D-alanine carboxypeptidase/D-alanyl-D-alanine-endopeptidase, partial [Acidimicrobiales bacterium]|nr:D-alanyl-D-alanine carboxypeptidase/D-alanyl-D-alanine-endopeptidase [Acidimicrobiales bacterium]